MARTHDSDSGASATAEPVRHPEEAALLRRLRDGQDEAFGELYELHAAAVRRLARGVSTDRSEAEDITAETFFRVLQALRRGAGPRDSARAYLLTVARRVSWEWQAARREVPTPEDELTSRVGSTYDKPAAAADQALIANAFSRLPERWRVVLWQTEVEGVQPAGVAPHFGLSANAAAALARRARLGLRAAYLQAHVSMPEGSGRCQTVLDKLGGYTAGVVTGTQARKVRAHLRRCPDCRATQGQLRDVSCSLRAHAGALVALVPATGLAIATGGSGAAGSAASTALVAVGTKMKLGLALASTAAAGALVAAPVVIEEDSTTPINLPAGVHAELTLASSTTTHSASPTSERRERSQADVRGSSAAQRSPVTLSPPRQVRPVPERARSRPDSEHGTTGASASTSEQQRSPDRQPRIDPAGAGSGDPETESTSSTATPSGSTGPPPSSSRSSTPSGTTPSGTSRSSTTVSTDSRPSESPPSGSPSF